MNILLYYPRLFVAFFLRPIPRTLPAFHHWNLAQLFYLWNEPWGGSQGSLASHAVRIFRKSDHVDPQDAKVKRTAMWLRLGYLAVVVYWPLISLMIALRKKGLAFFPYWNVLIDTFFLFADRPKTYHPVDAETLTHMSIYLPLLYLKAKTGQRFPDGKGELDAHCRRRNIPVPPIYRQGHPISAGNFIVKPVNGFGAKGISFTSDPHPYADDANVIVQQVMRNPAELRRLWGTDTLGSMRMLTLNFGDHYDLAGPSHLKVPVGDANTDNISQGNLFAMIDRSGRLSQLFEDRDQRTGLTHHPTTNVEVDSVVIPDYEACVQLAITVHKKLAPYAPFFNADVTITEQGPMLVEVNRIPGFPSAMFDEGAAKQIVEVTALALERAHRGETVPESVFDAPYAVAISA